MNLDQYQSLAKSTKKAAGLLYTGTALAGEVGEVCNEIKKWHRDDNQTLTPERKHRLLLELGDCLWYIASLADDLEASLETIALMNLQKLARRAEMGGNSQSEGSTKASPVVEGTGSQPRSRFKKD
jgi:NTP pyrophosphatase (non-canonical NTP hydrolase)